MKGNGHKSSDESVGRHAATAQKKAGARLFIVPRPHAPQGWWLGGGSACQPQGIDRGAATGFAAALSLVLAGARAERVPSTRMFSRLASMTFFGMFLTSPRSSADLN